MRQAQQFLVVCRKGSHNYNGMGYLVDASPTAVPYTRHPHLPHAPREHYAAEAKHGVSQA